MIAKSLEVSTAICKGRSSVVKKIEIDGYPGHTFVTASSHHFVGAVAGISILSGVHHHHHQQQQHPEKPRLHVARWVNRKDFNFDLHFFRGPMDRSATGRQLTEIRLFVVVFQLAGADFPDVSHRLLLLSGDIAARMPHNSSTTTSLPRFN